MLTKLSTFRGVSPEGEPLVRLFHQGDSITKVAAGYQPEVQDWLSTYTSDANTIALLVNAMGGSEYWGQNVNGDVFPWSVLAHDCRGRSPSEYPFDEFYGKRIKPYGFRTFLNAHPFVHHRNKDPGRAFGKVVVSCLNRKMKRVELVVLIDRALAAMHDAQPFVERLDAGEFPDVSMGCRVPYDVCTICGHKSKTKDDYCEHVKLLGMNHILDDGRRVGVINLHPSFFDISFVFIGADRTAKVMCKLASGLYVPESVLEGERIYELRDNEPGKVKASSIIRQEDLFAEYPQDRGLMGIKEPAATLREILAGPRGDLPAEHQAFRNEYTNPQAGYGDGALHTNAADGVDIQDAQNEKEAAFQAVTTPRFTQQDTEGVGHGYEQVDDGISGDPREATPSGQQKKQAMDDTLRAALQGTAAGALGGALGVGAMHLLRKKAPGIQTLPSVMGHAAGEWGLAGGATNAAMSRMARRQKTAAAKTLQAPPHREEYPYAGKYTWNGMTILVENATGTWRRGEHWATKMKNDYGEIEGSLGSDGDPVDVYMGPNEKAENVYIVHQNHAMGPKKGEYDEDKVMLGFDSAARAKAAYMAHYDNPERFFRSITEMPLAQFKKMIFRKEAQGEKLASEKEKVAIDLKLEDLFSTPNAVRRERVWKDKTTGESSYHTGSGLGTSFDNMQKTASVEDMDAKLAEVFKISERKTAGDKVADILKDIDPDATTGRVVEDLTDREECMPNELLDEAAGKGLESALTTPAMMGMVLKPEEFQRILLSAIGKSDLANELEQQGTVFNVRGACGCSAPCGPLGPDHFDVGLMRKLLPMLGGRSYLEPVVRKRIIRITITPKAKPAATGADSPLLTKVGAAYNWYRTEMVKAATYAPNAVADHPELHASVYGVGDYDLFGKEAELGAQNLDKRTVGAALTSVPIALMYSSSLRRDIERGEDVGKIQELIADHPNLTALGTGVLVRELMKNKNLNGLVGDAADAVSQVGRRLFTGGA